MSCAVASAVLSEIYNNNLISNSASIGKYLKEGLEELAKKSKIIGDVRGLGLLLAIEIVANKATKEIFDDKLRAVYRLAEIGMENGILLYTRKTANGAFGEWLMITPPLICTTEEIDLLLKLLSTTIDIFEKETGFY